MEVQAKELPGWTEENCENPQSIYQASWPRFELDIAKIRVKGVTSELSAFLLQ